MSKTEPNWLAVADFIRTALEVSDDQQTPASLKAAREFLEWIGAGE